MGSESDDAREQFIEYAREQAAVDDKRELTAAVERALETEDVDYDPGECVVCGEDTRLRCAPCGVYLCHHHESCPNGYDDQHFVA